jgi:peptide/nickel transport system permease protein
MTIDTDPIGPGHADDAAEVEWVDQFADVGFLRRIFQARKWYRADWWFVVISSVMVLIFIVLAAFPGFFAPHDPLEKVGPRLLAPGEEPAVEILVVPTDAGVAGIADLPSGARVPFAVQENTPSSEAARSEAEAVSETLDERIRLQIIRFETVPDALDAVATGEAAAAAMSSEVFPEFSDDYPTLTSAGPVFAGEITGESFTLGTNQIGQDVYSRIIWGTRIALVIGFSSAIASLVIGLPLGLIAGFFGGKLDRVMTLIMDSLYAFPGLILAIAITAVLGPSIFNIIVAIGVLYIPTYYRIVRGQALGTKESLYVEAARSFGAKPRTVLTRYIAPNVVPSVAIVFSLNVADAILTGAALSFLGLGLPLTTADWGIDLARGQEFIRSAWWLITFPGLAVMLVVLAFTMLGESLVEIFNPKLRDR